MRRVLSEISQETKNFEVSAVYMGITGVIQDGSIEKEIKSSFKSPSTVVSDIELAYRANFTDGEGILLYAGTGSVAYAINENSEVHKIGGWGYLLGEARFQIKFLRKFKQLIGAALRPLSIQRTALKLQL
jgi:N-acetylglucosamine kinase-like BadF-type ATPase